MNNQPTTKPDANEPGENSPRSCAAYGLAMSAYDKAKNVRRIVMNRAAEVMNYLNWGDDFAAKQIREIPEKLKEKIGSINVAELTEAEMDDLGFGRWSKDNPMRLIPLWLYPWLPDEIESACIDGQRAVLKKSEMDTDHRGGMLAYGIWPSATGLLRQAQEGAPK